MRDNSNRRDFLAATTAGFTLLLDAGGLTARTQQVSSPGESADVQSVDDLVAANRILAQHGIINEFGHVSVRDARNPSRFLMARSDGPQSVTATDLQEFDLDSRPLTSNVRSPYGERFIHGEIYKVRPDVNAVVHQHSPSVIPFGVTGVPLEPVYVAAGFIAEGVPVFDMLQAFGVTDMLVGDAKRGQALAQTLGPSPAVLMRGHGAVVVGASLPIAVARSIYLELNAKLQLQALALSNQVKYLKAGEARDVTRVAESSNWSQSWESWKGMIRRTP